ncbi:MAG TPA: 3-hydroxyacyl-CoA dehydrogenase NAD-binding domain-containing protein [Chitinophagaceae bacterium]|nr:3-hydroxyacyl-CoA dehydrogenase NAD-binding domain-containing protein [Chitinophagaceae bacterium]
MVNSLCVCGAGTMGRGIAQLAARRGVATLLYELNPAALEKARQEIQLDLDKLVAKSRMSGTEKEQTLQRLSFTASIEDCLADACIEAIVEEPEAKSALFNQLAEINHSETVFASNTSSLSVAQIAAQVRNPERVIGMHFFNPPTIMQLVELVVTPENNEATIRFAHHLAEQLGKTVVVCRDSPGFIVNRVARPYYIESLRLVEAGLTDFQQLDSLLEASGFRMGPFRLMDLIGNDVNYLVSTSVYEQLGRPERLRPSPIQEKKVAGGELGRKSGKGYYDYNTAAD